MTDLSRWAGAPRPDQTPLRGTYVDLEPLSPTTHAADLYTASAAHGSEARFRYMAEDPPADLSELSRWAQGASESTDPLFYAVIDRATGRAEGRQALMRIDEHNGVIEIGHIVWGPRLARTRGATEAFFLFADYVFALGYRRLEWKCNNDNEPSKRAAERFGFTHEGLFRQHMVVKGHNRDTAWFALLDAEWTDLRDHYLRWLDPGNFDHFGLQRTRLNLSARSLRSPGRTPAGGP